MNRIWFQFDARPAHLRPVVGWWEWHTRWRFTPGRCRVCKQRRDTPHKMDCSRRGQPIKPMPLWLGALVIVGVGGANFSLVYVLSKTGLPDVTGLWGFLAILAMLAISFNYLFWRAYTDWRQTR